MHLDCVKLSQLLQGINVTYISEKLPNQRQCNHQENVVNKNGETRVQPSNNY